VGPLRVCGNHYGLNAKSRDSEQIKVLLLQKLATNCVNYDPLTALWETQNGKLFEQPSFASTKEQVVNEVSRIGQTLHPGLGEELSTIVLDGFVEEVIQDNLQNKASVFNNVKKEHRTQVDNLNEYIVRKGRELWH
jgi:ketopantoate reductase